MPYMGSRRHPGTWESAVLEEAREGGGGVAVTAKNEVSASTFSTSWTVSKTRNGGCS